MSRVQRLEGMEMVATRARERLPRGTRLDWVDRGESQELFGAVAGGRRTGLLTISNVALEDIPGSDADTSGQDIHWPEVRGFVDLMVDDWIDQHAPDE